MRFLHHVTLSAAIIVPLASGFSSRLTFTAEVDQSLRGHATAHHSKREYLCSSTAVKPLIADSATVPCILAPLHGTVVSNGSRTSRKSSATVEPDTSNNDDPQGNTSMFEPLGAGVTRDFGRRLPYFRSDITDGLNAQSLATVLYLFFACLAPAIGFGGILGLATDGAMGAIEMVASTALCGVLYALFAAQPIQLIGPMGPNLAYTVSLNQLAENFSLPFLPLYAWTGLWTAGMLMVASLTSASNLVR
jgi:hypothetical protein